MPKEFLKYDESIFFIKDDLKRLKGWRSLKGDIYSCYEIIRGGLSESLWPPPYNFLGGMITEIKRSNGTLLCFKDKVAISNPFLSPAKGARLIYALVKEHKIFIPFVVFKADEEGKLYKINRKRFILTKSNFGKIINEKLKWLDKS